jgi:large subunit ribosomal protein L13Ae
VRTEEITISGGIVRQQAKFDRYLAKRTVTNPARGPYHFRSPSKILWRTIRGCVPTPPSRAPAAGCPGAWGGQSCLLSSRGSRGAEP